MKHVIFKMLGLFLLLPTVSYSAVFKIFNRTGVTIKVRPFWNDSSIGYTELAAGGETGAYDCGFHNIKGVVYEILIPQTADQVKTATFCTRRYIARCDISEWAVGGKFYIQSDAHCAYAFDTIAGSGTLNGEPFNG